jgi:hypothetical protein
MYDKEIVFDLLNRMEALTDRIHERFKGIRDVSELTSSSAGVEKLDLLWRVHKNGYPRLDRRCYVGCGHGSFYQQAYPS